MPLKPENIFKVQGQASCTLPQKACAEVAVALSSGTAKAAPVDHVLAQGLRSSRKNW